MSYNCRAHECGASAVERMFETFSRGAVLNPDPVEGATYTPHNRTAGGGAELWLCGAEDEGDWIMNENGEAMPAGGMEGMEGMEGMVTEALDEEQLREMELARLDGLLEASMLNEGADGRFEDADEEMEQ
jgi:hypothetical protein